MSKKISELSPVASLAGTEYIPVVQGGTTMRATISQLGGGASFTVDCEIGVTPVIDGGISVSGLTNGSSAIVSTAFANRNVRVIRGSLPLPRTAPTDGSNYFTKSFVSGTIALNAPLVTGEYIMIEPV